MSSIVNEQRAVEVMGRWSPTDMALVRSLDFRERADATGSDLEIEFVACKKDQRSRDWPWGVEPKFRVRVAFRRVRDLKLDEFGGIHTQINGFDIRDISDRGWEGTRYEIEDYEDGRIAFLCDEIEVLDVRVLSASCGPPGRSDSSGPGA
jgi:hypothetical protein